MSANRNGANELNASGTSVGASDMLDVLLSEQPLNEDDRKLVNVAYERLVVFEQANRVYHQEAKGCREVLRLRDPGQDAPAANPLIDELEETTTTVTLASNQNRDRRTLQLNTLKSTINNCVADQMSSMPDAKLTPETPDQQDISNALQDALRYVIYDVNNFERIHRRRVEDFYCTGSGLIQTGWDEDANYGEGEITLIRWPIEAFCWDPKAEDLQEARALIKVSWHPMSWYRAHYPELGKYVQAEDDMYNDVGMPETQLLDEQADEGRALLMEYWYRTFDGKKYHINVAHIAGHTLLEKKEDVFDHGMYPFELDAHSLIEGQPVGEGLVGELVNTMRYINRYAKYIDTNARLSAKARILLSNDSGIDATALLDFDKDAITGNSIRKGIDWDYFSNPPFNGMIANQMINMMNDLKQDSGANQATRGEPAGGVTSGKGLIALQQAGGKIAQMRTGTLNDGFKQMVWQVLCLMAQFYDNKRLRKITGKDESFPAFFDTDKKVPRYTVQVEVHQKDPLRIQAQNQMFIDMYTMAAQAQQYFPISALIQLLNVEGKDRITPVIQEMEQKGDKIRQLSDQNVQLIEQLTQMQKENDALKQTQTQSVNALASVGKRGPQVNQGRQAVV